MPEPALLAAAALTFLVAGLVKGVIGLGLPTIAMGLLSLAMTPADAAALLVIPALLTNLWQMAAGPHLLPLLRRLWPMLAGVCVGTWLTPGLGGESTGATAALGIALIVYAVASLGAIRFRVAGQAEPWLSPLLGAATGAVTSATGVFVIPAVPYLQALALDRDAVVQALGLSFTVSTLALAATLIRADALPWPLAGVSMLALAPAVLGMVLGQRLRRRLRPEIFRRWFFAGLLALGGHLAVSGLR